MNVPALSQALLVLRTVGEQVPGVLGSCVAGVIPDINIPIEEYSRC